MEQWQAMEFLYWTLLFCKGAKVRLVSLLFQTLSLWRSKISDHKLHAIFVWWQVPRDVEASFPCWLCRLLLHTPVQMPLQVFRRGLLVLCGDCQYQKQIGRFKSSLLLYIKSRCHRNHHYSCHHGSNLKFHFMYCMILFYGAVHFFFV